MWPWHGHFAEVRGYFEFVYNPRFREGDVCTGCCQTARGVAGTAYRRISDADKISLQDCMSSCITDITCGAFTFVAATELGSGTINSTCMLFDSDDRNYIQAGPFVGGKLSNS